MALLVDEPEGMDAKPLHHRKASRQRAVAHDPHQHVSRFRSERDEVPERVMRRSRLGDLVVRLGLHGMDEVRKLDRILNKEDGDVVADQIPDAFVRVELDGKSANIARRIGGSPRSGNRRKADEDGRLLRRVAEQLRLGEMGQVFVDLEIAVRRRPARVNDPLRDPLVVEVCDLLAEVEIFKQGRPALPGLERILIVPDGQTLIGGERVRGGRRIALQRLGFQRFLASRLNVRFTRLARSAGRRGWVRLPLLGDLRPGFRRRSGRGLGHGNSFSRHAGDYRERPLFSVGRDPVPGRSVARLNSERP